MASRFSKLNLPLLYPNAPISTSKHRRISSSTVNSYSLKEVNWIYTNVMCILSEQCGKMAAGSMRIKKQLSHPYVSNKESIRKSITSK